MMQKRSKFRYEVVLRLRQQKEKAASQDLACALMETQRAKSNMDRLAAAVGRETVAARACLQLSAGVTPQGYGRYRQAVTDLRLAMAKEGVRMTKIQDELTIARARLIEAMKHRKAIQRLKNRMILSSRAIEARQATAQLDDLHAIHSAMKSDQ